MTRICNFPISETERCKQPVADNKPNCGRHRTELSASQVGQSPTVYTKDGEIHVWAGEPDGLYCMVHNGPTQQALYQLIGEASPCCLRKSVEWTDEDGRLHRDDGPAVIHHDGTQEWWQHGERHRDNGPAVVFLNGAQFWCRYGKLHREDGPAAVWPYGSRHWYWYGERVTEEGHARLRKQSGGI